MGSLALPMVAKSKESSYVLATSSLAALCSPLLAGTDFRRHQLSPLWPGRRWARLGDDFPGAGVRAGGGGAVFWGAVQGRR